MNKQGVNLDNVLNQIISQAKSTKTTDIIKGISDRLCTRGSITPKQANWITEQIECKNAILQDIWTVTEKKASLPDQEWALKSLQKRMEAIESTQHNHMDRLFVIEHLEKIDNSLHALYKHLDRDV